MKFRIKLFLILICVSIVPIFLIGLISYFDDERIITESTLNNLKFFVEKEKKNIENIIEFNSREVDLISTRIELLQSIDNYKNEYSIENQEKLDEVLNKVKNILNGAEKISITDLDGNILASTKNVEINQKIDYEKFDNIKKTNGVMTDFVLTNEGKPSVWFSKILTSGTNQIGIIFIEFDYEKIFGRINTGALGGTSEFFVAEKISEKEILLIYPLITEESTLLKRTLSIENTKSPIIQAIMKNEGQFLYLVNLENEPVLAVTGYIEKPEWGITATVEKSEVFLPLQLSIFIIVLVFVMISITITLIAIFFSKTIARPINEIVNKSNQITKGNLNVRLDIKTNDELKTLSDSLNDMIESLKKKIKVEEELEDSKNQLRNERINTIGILAAQIAHDIKNPLQTIRNSTDIIKNQILNNKIVSREIDRIDRGVFRIAHQVDDVLDYINTTQISVSKESILKIIQSTLESLKIPKNIQITQPENDLIIECDPAKIESVFSNILLNAIDAIGIDEGHIKIRLSKIEENAIIEFENSGPIIKEDILPRIFEPLFSTKEKGTGLGLVSCKNIIERHGGIINVTSDPVIFKIIIPMSQNVKNSNG